MSLTTKYASVVSQAQADPVHRFASAAAEIAESSPLPFPLRYLAPSAVPRPA